MRCIYLLLCFYMLVLRIDAADWPGNATKELPWVNSLGLKFVPAGTPKVLFCIWDVRVKDWREFLRSSHHQPLAEYWSTPFSNYKQTDQDPVVCVYWEEAKAFCAWLTSKEHKSGILPPQWRYTLPTDAEWSTAVGLKEPAGTPKGKDGVIEGVYPWGTQWPPPADAGNYWRKEGGKGRMIEPCDGYGHTSPAGHFHPNHFGLYDMGGNVWQWCETKFTPDKTEGLLRGGSWTEDDKETLLCSFRMPDLMDENDVGGRDIGFRCVLRMEK